MLAAPIWVRLFGLPVEFWDPEILEGIGNTIGDFVKIAEATKRGKYTSYARLCVYMNIAEPLPEYIELEYHDEIWQQPIDYEHIPFRCRKCHEYGHLYRQCPSNKEAEFIRKKEEQQRETEKTEEADRGFQQVIRKKKTGKEGIKIQTQEKTPNIESQNKFKILQENSEEYEDDMEEEDGLEDASMEIVKEIKEKGTGVSEMVEGVTAGKTEVLTSQTQMEVESQKDNEAEEERIMRQLIQEWKSLDERFIPDSQKQLYKETFQKYKEKKGKSIDKQETIVGEQESSQIGIGGTGKSSRKRGRKTMSETIQTVGETLINSGKVIPLSEVFFQPSKSLK